MIPSDEAFASSASNIDSNIAERSTTSSYKGYPSSVSSSIAGKDANHTEPFLLQAMDHGLLGYDIVELNAAMAQDLDEMMARIDEIGDSMPQ